MNAYIAHMLNFKHVIRHTQCIIWNLWHLRNHIMLINIEYFAHNAKCAIYILYSCVNKATGDLWSSVKLLGAQSLRNQVELGKIDWPIDPMNSVFICLYLVVSSSVDELRDIWEWRQGTPELVQVDWPIGRDSAQLAFQLRACQSPGNKALATAQGKTHDSVCRILL